ncbi:DEAD/DEAH box helicase, partial [Sphingobacterium sp.]|uniref:DEAD/DEAH box helicase n=1 Tax=Sphingobacterium sp. TaxID=341027 RepID=UPI0028A03175
MSSHSNFYHKIFTNEELSSIIRNLTFNQFIVTKSTNLSVIPIGVDTIKKCIWLCSILAGSSVDEHRKKVQLFASLLYLQNQGNLNIENACFILQSRVGNLTASRLFNNFQSLTKDFSESESQFDAFLSYELATEWNDKNLEIGEEEILLSRFQKRLWVDLNSTQTLSISAPTSAGKSFILKKYVTGNYKKFSKYRVLYIVPSKALINQVSEEFRSDVLLTDVNVKTAFLEEDMQITNDKEVYVLTPERCLRLIQYFSNGNSDYLNLIFIDEIQNIENEDGRGSLLEYILHELKITFSRAQIIIAGPHISNSADLFYNIFDQVGTGVETTVSPVFQIKTIIRPLDDRQTEIEIKSHDGIEHKFFIETDLDFQRKINKSFADGLASIIEYFSLDQQNIIYSPRTDYAEDWALKYVIDGNKRYDNLDIETKELIDYLKEEIHPKYFLIRCLEGKSAFHHSKLPDIVRKEIEDGYLASRIKNLFCTSTLLEGVNLPANNLFIVSPKKLNQELTGFEFGNLIGRAGRIRDNLYGTIYCVERDKNSNWASSYYDKTIKKNVKTVSEKALSEIDVFEDSINKPIFEVKDPKIKNTIIFLRNKYLREPDSIPDYLNKRGVDKDKSTQLLEKLDISLNGVTIPGKIVKLNPSIDPILQDALYSKIAEEGIAEWAIVPNKNFYSGISKAEKDAYSFQETSLFWQLVSVMERLNEIFNISEEVFYQHKISSSIRQICFYGTRWLQSVSYQSLIASDIKFYSEHVNPDKRIDGNDDKAINGRINEVIKIYGTIVSYVLVKYLKLVNDLLASFMSEEEKEKYKFCLSLPTGYNVDVAPSAGHTDPSI